MLPVVVIPLLTHRLLSSSPFGRRFYGGFAEAGQETIEVDDIEAAEFKTMYAYAYLHCSVSSRHYGD